MRLIFISLLALFMSLMLVASGNAYLMSLIGVRLGMANTPPTEIGWIMTFYSIGFVIGSIFAQRLLIRVGHIRAFSTLASLAAMAALLYPFAEDFWVWSLLRIIGGFSVAGLFIAIESWFSAVASDNNRATLFSLYTIAAYSAAASGQVILGHSSGLQISTAFIIAGLLLIAAVIPLSASRLQSPPLETAEFMSLQRLWRKSALGLFSAFCGGLLIGSFYALVPLYATLSDIATDQISTLMSISVMSAMLFAWPIGWLCDRITRSKVLTATALVAALAALGASLFGSDQFVLLILSTSLFMAMIAAIYSIAVAITNDLIRSEERVAASSTLMLSYGLGSIAGPLLGSMLLGSFAPGSLFLGFVVILLMLVVFTLFRQVQKPPVPIEEQEQFIPAMPETQVIAEFDPRTEDLPDTAIEELFPDEVVEAVQGVNETDQPVNSIVESESLTEETLEPLEGLAEQKSEHSFDIHEEAIQAQAEETSSQKR
ncbi:MFS transporter [Marinobacterium sp. xm-a-152]|uniref:MFS transporter n=1 Tax=Marinobacterium sp. xm-a-152 TaxID=2497733 RepID=UPI00156A4DF1|nr:MFS transporter [Marinobacterium sp. xm-a-152]NRP15650.1 putative MFS-type transporter YcaD [Marinobacterium sp. xm-a-152]